MVTGLNTDVLNFLGEYCAAKCRKLRAHCTCSSSTFEKRLFVPRIIISDYSGSLDVAAGGDECLALLGNFEDNESLKRAVEEDINYPILRALSVVRILIKPRKVDDQVSWSPTVVRAGLDDYTSAERAEQICELCPANVPRGTPVIPALIDLVEVSADGLMMVASEAAAYIAVFAVATKSAILEKKDDAYAITYAVHLVADADVELPFTVRADCPHLCGPRPPTA